MYSGLDTLWVLLGAALVFFMQAGFAMVETGFTRAKNAGNIIMKNLLDVSIGSVAYWVIGFGIMFGGSSALCGTIDLFVLKTGIYDFGSVPLPVFMIFQTVFCATSATIVSGAMAERTKFSTYCVFSLIISAIVYPISGHWIWGGGWLAQLGFHDFAGSTAVHMVGGLAALIGAAMVGPRIGKFTKEGKARAIPGHSLTLGALGVFILWTAWFGFNGCSTLSLTGDEAIISAGQIFLNTNLAAAAGALAAMFFTWFRYKKPDISMTLNGALAGLVGITAGCDMVSTAGAFWIGLICGVAVVLGVQIVENVFKVDDPVGAVGVHFVCGALGTILVGVFATEGGVLYGGGLKFLGIQTLGVVSVMAWVALTMVIAFKILDMTMGLRVSREEELAGLDIQEHGVASYADFMPSASAAYDTLLAAGESSSAPAKAKVATEESVAVIDKRVAPANSGDGALPKMTKATVITSHAQFNALKETLDALGITGMTITHVSGCGMQRGHTEYYRGAELDSTLLPKVQVDVVISKIPVQVFIDAVVDTLRTGHIGDGKIFLYDVERVVRISSGAENYEALQDELSH